MTNDDSLIYFPLRMRIFAVSWTSLRRHRRPRFEMLDYLFYLSSSPRSLFARALSEIRHRKVVKTMENVERCAALNF
jgi:hypothetical protein